MPHGNEANTMEFLAQKVDGVLIGADEFSRAKIANLGLDTVIKCKVSKKRNYKNLQRFMVFIDEAYHMQNHWSDKEHFRKWLTMKAGYYDAVVAPNGSTMFLPHSISFDKMEEEEFKLAFKKIVNTFLDEFKIKMTDNDFWRIVDFE